jgi:signal peptidase
MHVPASGTTSIRVGGPARSDMKKVFWKTLIGFCTLSYALHYCVQVDMRVFVVATGSMTPLIPAKSVVVSRRVGTDGPRTGAVIIFNSPDNKRVTVHRIIEFTDDRYVTKGDVNNYPDRYLVRSANILGEVIAICPIVGYTAITIQMIYLALTLVLGILLRRFLLFLKHGIFCPSSACNALH